MASERDYWACANQLIGQHGGAAAAHAWARAEELAQAGDVKGATTWRAVARRIALLNDHVGAGAARH